MSIDTLEHPVELINKFLALTESEKDLMARQLGIDIGEQNSKLGEEGKNEIYLTLIKDYGFYKYLKAILEHWETDLPVPYLEDPLPVLFRTGFLENNIWYVELSDYELQALIFKKYIIVDLIDVNIKLFLTCGWAPERIQSLFQSFNRSIVNIHCSFDQGSINSFKNVGSEIHCPTTGAIIRLCYYLIHGESEKEKLFYIESQQTKSNI